MFVNRLECKLAGIVINLKATYEEIKTHAAREKFKSQVMGCLRAWREWNVYSGEFLLQLDIIFIGGKDSEEPSPDDVMDGMPLDVDGVPLAKDSDVDGTPMDVDGVPLVVPRPRKSKFDDDDIFTKSSTPPPSLGSKWETSNWESSAAETAKVKRSEPVYTPKEESDEKRKKKREIEVKVAEYVDKLESGKCTRIKEITTTDQAEIYRYLLLKGRDAKKSIKQIATGKITLQSVQQEMKAQPCTSPILSERDRKHSKKRSKNNSMSALVASYGSSGPSRSPSPEPSKRKREDKKRSKSPKHEKKKKSRH